MKEKPITPYARLLSQFQRYCRDVEYRHCKPMCVFQKDNLAAGYRLDDLAQWVLAAEQLGYDTVLKVSGGDLQAFYVAKVPERPTNI